jgi:hypothetical protein
MYNALVLPSLKWKFCGAEATILFFFDLLKRLTAFQRVFMASSSPLPYIGIKSAREVDHEL